jgi:hypothetical protein
MPVDVKREAHLRNAHQQVTIDPATSQQLLRSRYSLSQPVLITGHLGLKGFGIIIEALASFDYLDTLLEIRNRRDLSVEAETIEKLRPQFTLFGIARAYEHEPSGMADGNALAFDYVAARRRRVKQDVYYVIIEQIHFVDVEEAAIGARQQSGFERLHSLNQRALDIERPAHPILRCSKWQIDNRNRATHTVQLAVARQFGGAVFAQLVHSIGVAAVRAALNLPDWRKQIGQCANGGRLTRPAMTHNDDTTDVRVNDAQQQREFHLLLADDPRERIDDATRNWTR